MNISGTILHDVSINILSTIYCNEIIKRNTKAKSENEVIRRCTGDTHRIPGNRIRGYWDGHDALDTLKPAGADRIPERKEITRWVTIWEKLWWTPGRITGRTKISVSLKHCTEHGWLQKRKASMRIVLKKAKWQQELQRKSIHGQHGASWGMKWFTDPEHCLDAIWSGAVKGMEQYIKRISLADHRYKDWQQNKESGRR